MPKPTTYPGVYVQEIETDAPKIVATPTSITAFVGQAPQGPVNDPVAVRSFAEFSHTFGGLCRDGTLGYAVQHFFLNGGTEALLVRTQDDLPESLRKGLAALDQADLFNLMCIPPPARDRDVDKATWEAALAYCQHRRAMLIVDPPASWTGIEAVENSLAAAAETPDRDANAALYFPRLRMADPLQDGRLETFAPGGTVAGIYARTDTRHGVWKAPAGQRATLAGVSELAHLMTDAENDRLNRLGVNALRHFSGTGDTVWGARTMAGGDAGDSEWKYVPVRRLALFLEESLDRGTQWAVFEPNDEPLWAQIRFRAGAFLEDLFRQGALQGQTSRDAYFVKCDADTTTPNDIEQGIVNFIVGFAPLRPAEFLTFKISQTATAADT